MMFSDSVVFMPDMYQLEALIKLKDINKHICQELLLWFFSTPPDFLCWDWCGLWSHVRGHTTTY